MNQITKYVFLALLFLWTLTFVYSQELSPEEYKAIASFIDLIKTNNSDALKDRVVYPLKRSYPIPEVKNANDFEKRYNDLFDANLKTLISNSSIADQWSSVGWRGLMFDNGTLWLNREGYLIALNYESNTEQTQKSKLIQKSTAGVHESLKDFDTPVLIIQTKKFKIRIDALDNDRYQYAAWSKDAPMTDTPDLVLKNGHYIPDGSGGNHRYEFKNGRYTYTVYRHVLGTSDTPPAELMVHRDDKELLSHSAIIIKE